MDTGEIKVAIVTSLVSWRGGKDRSWMSYGLLSSLASGFNSECYIPAKFSKALEELVEEGVLEWSKPYEGLGSYRLAEGI